MKIKTSSAKAKGRKLQQYVCTKLREIFNLGERDVKSCSMGAGGEDILLSDAAFAILPLSLECKNTQSFPSLAALKQAKENAPEGALPGVCWKPPGKRYEETIIYFNLIEYLEEVRKAYLNVVKELAKG